MKEHLDPNGVNDEQLMQVFCAWCTKYLYSVVAVHKVEYSHSHGICKDCMGKYFKGIDD